MAIHTFEAQMEHDQDPRELEDDAFVDWIEDAISATLEQYGSDYTIEDVDMGSVHACLDEPCENYLPHLVTLKGSVTPHSQAGLPMWSTAQRGEA